MRTVLVLSLVSLLSACAYQPVKHNYSTYHSFRITTPSMLPAYPIGMQVSMARGDYGQIKPGMVITFFSQKYRQGIMHRVTHLTKYGWAVKGDNNWCWDKEYVTPENFVGFIYPQKEKI